VEGDTEKRRSIAFELQRYLAKAMYADQPSGLSVLASATAWPALANFNVYQRACQNASAVGVTHETTSFKA
jgi:hypothetical protein